MLEVPLEDGVTVGEETIKLAKLRPLKARDIFAANEAAEKVHVVQIGDGLEPVLLRSPTAANKEALRRQITKLGDLDGPIALEVLGQFSERDLETLMDAAATLQQGAAKEADRRGRGSGGKKPA